jgi:hypothetical protein
VNVPTASVSGKVVSASSTASVRFWTNARVRQAISRDFEMNSETK